MYSSLHSFPKRNKIYLHLYAYLSYLTLLFSLSFFFLLFFYSHSLSLSLSFILFHLLLLFLCSVKQIEILYFASLVLIVKLLYYFTSLPKFSTLVLLPSPNNAVHMLINKIRIVSAHMSYSLIKTTTIKPTTVNPTTINPTTVKICDDSRSRSKRCERTNRRRGKAATINFETFEKTSIQWIIMFLIPESNS